MKYKGYVGYVSPNNNLKDVYIYFHAFQGQGDLKLEATWAAW